MYMTIDKSCFFLLAFTMRALIQEQALTQAMLICLKLVISWYVSYLFFSRDETNLELLFDTNFVLFIFTSNTFIQKFDKINLFKLFQQTINSFTLVLN